MDDESLTTVPALDHRMFPHIIDLIVSFAPRESLLVLRRTSWDMCDRADIELALYIMVLEYNYPDRTQPWALEIGTLDGRLPLFYSIQQGSKAELRPHPFLTSKTVARAKRAFSKTRIFDVTGDISFCDLPTVEREIFKFFTGVTNLRVDIVCSIDDADIPDLVGSEWSLVCGATFDVNMLGVWSASKTPKCADGVKRVTLWARGGDFESDEETSRYSNLITHPASLREVVVILDAESFYRGYDYLHHVHSHLGFLGPLVEDAVPYLDRVGYTFVNLADLPPKSLNLGHAFTRSRADPSDVKTAFYAKLKSLLRTVYPHSDADVTMRLEAVKVVSKDEYIEHVGPEWYEWETTSVFELPV